MQQEKALTWNDVADAADLAFHIWVGQPELRWAKQAWELIIKAGLATYTNEWERCKAVIRFLALCGLYHDFCKVAWDEKDEPNYVEWIEPLGVGAFRIGALVGAKAEWSERTENDEDDELFSNALQTLADEARDEVYWALLEGFGNESMMFVSLWRSNQRKRSEMSDNPYVDFYDDDEHPQSEDDFIETDEEILNYPTADKMAGFSWIAAGCEPIS